MSGRNWGENTQQGRELSKGVSRVNAFSLSVVKSSLNAVSPPCPEAQVGIGG